MLDKKKAYERYKELRGDKTDKEVAIATGIDQATLSNWGSGNYMPKVDKLMKIAKYFDVAVDEFLIEVEDSNGKDNL